MYYFIPPCVEGMSSIGGMPSIEGMLYINDCREQN